METLGKFGLICVVVNVITSVSLFANQSLDYSSAGERIIQAIISGDSAAVEQLATNDAVINYKDKYGMTPLHFAASRGRLSIAKLLIERGAKINVATKDGTDTPLSIAADEGQKDVADLLIAKGAIMTVHIAAALGRTTDLKSMIQSGRSVDSMDHNHNTPLHFAAEHCQSATAKMLIELSADVHARDKYYWTPLHYACDSGCPSVARLLIENGADVNSRTMNLKPFHSWFTPLHLAAGHCETKYEKPKQAGGDKELVILLLQKGADVNAKSSSGETALDMARKKSSPSCDKISELLLDHSD